MRGPGRLWPLLFPGAYLLHLAEEIWGGPGFVAWAAHHLSPAFTADRFLLVNGVAWPAMLISSLVAIRFGEARWLVAALATIVLVNGILHLSSSVATGSYSPGTVSGVLVYLPLGLLSLRRAAREVPRGPLAWGVAVGLAVHGLVVVVAFGLR